MLDRYFDHELGFGKQQDVRGWVTIIEPESSKTYELEPRVGMESASRSAMSVRLCNDYVRLFQAVVSRDDFVYAYDPHHSSYKFWPHLGFKYESEDEWPIPPYPDGDYCAFFLSNLKGCLFGFPWHQPTVCVIGIRLLDAMPRFRPKSFAKVVRIGGKPVR